ncbi:long-chain fatty acid--CoA ligase [Variovorax paradoxus]|nr:long-chain fatty acid--CoA ligase [Variovorax paradoxus]MBT2301887.1 long-chain fatty acid--CoA ligase [Variovorax paradoxus]
MTAITLEADASRITQAIHHAVQLHGHKQAVIDSRGVRTWREVADRVARGAAVLKSLAIASGDRVAVLASSSSCNLELVFAVPWAGAVLVPLNTRLAPAELESAVRDSGASVLAVDDEHRVQGQALARNIPQLRLLYIGAGHCPNEATDLEVALAAAAPMEDACEGGSRLWAIFYTGGTTGLPKGVMLTHDNICYSALSWLATFGFTPDTRYLHLAGFFHIAGMQPVIALTMAGGCHVIEPKFDPLAAMKAIQQHRPNYSLFVPTMLNMMLHHPEFQSHDVTSVRRSIYGGAPMPEALIALAMEKLPGWEFIQGYGQTEACGLVAFLPWDKHFGEGTSNKRKLTGCPAYGMEMRVVDTDGRPVAPNVVGEVVVRGPNVMAGYWNNPGMSAQVLRDGWLHSGDGGYMDEDGFLCIVDRLKDMIVTGGENVFSKEVENAVQLHPAVQACAVIGIPHPKWGEAVHAVVMLKPGQEATDREIVEHCRTLIAGFKLPRSVEFRTALPVSAAGKIMKAELRRALL